MFVVAQCAHLQCGYNNKWMNEYICFCGFAKWPNTDSVRYGEICTESQRSDGQRSWWVTTGVEQDTISQKRECEAEGKKEDVMMMTVMTPAGFNSNPL